MQSNQEMFVLKAKKAFHRLFLIIRLFDSFAKGKATDVGCIDYFTEDSRVNKRHLYQRNSITMISTSMKSNTKEVGNINVSGRLKQILVLILAILIGMIISVTIAEAKDNQTQRKNKAAYRKQANLMANACQLLSNKRNNTTNFVVKDRSKLKYR